jgi:hypothetical protein
MFTDVVGSTHLANVGEKYSEQALPLFARLVRPQCLPKLLHHALSILPPAQMGCAKHTPNAVRDGLLHFPIPPYERLLAVGLATGEWKTCR